MSATHTGATPGDCPVCRPAFKDACRLKAAKVRKVYGRVSVRARREHSANQRDAQAIFDRLFRDHSSAMHESHTDGVASGP